MIPNDLDRAVKDIKGEHPNDGDIGTIGGTRHSCYSLSTNCLIQFIWLITKILGTGYQAPLIPAIKHLPQYSKHPSDLGPRKLQSPKTLYAYIKLWPSKFFTLITACKIDVHSIYRNLGAMFVCWN